jgi:hypothetical protein
VTPVHVDILKVKFSFLVLCLFVTPVHVDILLCEAPSPRGFT